MNSNAYSTAYYALTEGIGRIESHRRMGRKILDNISGRLPAVLPQAEVVRWADILFITLTGFRVYFRGSYNIAYASIEFGWWGTTERGFPIFSKSDEWKVEEKEDSLENDRLHALWEMSLVQIVDLLGWTKLRDGTFQGVLPTGLPYRPLCRESRFISRSETAPQA